MKVEIETYRALPLYVEVTEDKRKSSGILNKIQNILFGE